MAVEKIRIPDFGDVQKITVVEIFIKPGDQISVEDPLIALESEKAVMDIPSPLAGTVKEILVTADAVVKSGDVIALVETAAVPDREEEKPVEKAEPPAAAAGEGAVSAPETAGKPRQSSHATPSVRAFAREKGVDLAGIAGTGPGGRILREDVLATLSGEKAPAAVGEDSQPATHAKVPAEDFSTYGPVEEVVLGRIKKISGPHLQRSWATIPHVTHFDEADITELESFRKQLNAGLKEGEIPFSPLVFIVKALAATLAAFPIFNSSLLPEGDKVVLKKYYHIGIAVDTPNGLVVPVLRDVDKKGFAEIAAGLKVLSGNARAGKSTIPEMQGASFNVSSLGGIGGTGFTPIVSAPQVAVLGVSRSSMKQRWDGQEFVPRLILPLSVSYDHRVIDGAEAARFCRALCTNIEDLRRIML